MDSKTTLNDIYEYLKSEYDGKVFSDNFLDVRVDLVEDKQVEIGFDLEKPVDFDPENPDDEGWWQDKVDSAMLLYDDVVTSLVGKFGEEFDYSEIGLSDDNANRRNFYGRFEVAVDDESDDTLPTVLIRKSTHEYNEGMERIATNGEAMVVEDIFDALGKIDGYIVDFSDNGYEIYLTDTKDDSCYTISVKQE